MSTDHESRQDLPRIQVPPIKIQTLGSCSTSEDLRDDVIQQENGDECRTPTSEEHKIPAILSCPPAPRKPRRRTVLRKRKLSEFEFFEIVNRQEVESFFGSSFEVVAPAKKRSCPCK
ncbi:hypothetical protein P3X46_025327 [Hevea brasiliensis]|uniref:Cyclin-dependent protein kinase inhibitor n=1 Tax=Hevea brasiliensis TaxID=3981 RepID=A0ABQ9L5C9_HEVBR|nr:cyclin-dependent protein kinase inhibitor SMR1-like [Hevea brasiliensis]KAJ9159870.1 hypothetical protein P3X46_025327 [Hevea brasiliensis]